MVKRESGLESLVKRESG